MSKDFFAEQFAILLNERTNTPMVERHAFGDNVRAMCEILTGVYREKTHSAGQPFFNDVYNYTQENKNLYIEAYGMTIGEVLQQAGTDAIRNHFNPNTWLISLYQNQVKKALDRGNIVILPDTRFPNEADKIIDNGGLVFRMVGDPLGIRANSKRDLTHISETALDDYQRFSGFIDNKTADIVNLRNQIDNIQRKHLFI